MSQVDKGMKIRGKNRSEISEAYRKSLTSGKVPKKQLGSVENSLSIKKIHNISPGAATIKDNIHPKAAHPPKP
jgi:hypothetical protein